MLEEIREPIAAELEEVEREIRALAASEIPAIDAIVERIVLRKGKRLRPMLVLLASGMSGRVTGVSIKAAAMVELLHGATLIHDDVVDTSDMRRGEPSVNAVWGNKASILIGDLFFSRVLFRLAELNDRRLTHITSMAIKRICEGELLQLQNGVDYGAIEERTYLDLIDKKTASLISVACELGAISSSSSDGAGARAALRSFGADLGTAFQIKDDVMDIVGTPQSLGKPTSNDLLERTVTLPLIHGLRHSKNGDRETVLAILKRGVTEGDLGTIHRFVRESGGVEYAEQRAREFRDRALARLALFDDSIYKRSLVKLAGFIVDRAY